jgi:competence protein ComFC
MWMIRTFFSSLADIAFPPYCFICKKEGETLCNECLEKRSKSIDTPFPFITSIYSFRDPDIKKIIHSIKYFHRMDLIYPLTKQLIDTLKTHNPNEFILIPIPMPKLRRYLRGHNHTERIAHILSIETSISVDSTILLRTHAKKRQVLTKSKSERLKNQKGSFYVTKTLPNLKYILIDDVTTTGATLLEARKELIKHGARHVEALTIAH